MLPVSDKPNQEDDVSLRRGVGLKVSKCLYAGCQTPSPGGEVDLADIRPEDALYWSQPEDWDGTDVGWGGYNQQLPTHDQNVKIKEGQCV